MSSEITGERNMRLSLGINGKYLSTLQGRLFFSESLYLGLLHLGQRTSFSYDPLNNTHSPSHAWIVL